MFLVFLLYVIVFSADLSLSVDCKVLLVCPTTWPVSSKMNKTLLKWIKNERLKWERTIELKLKGLKLCIILIICINIWHNDCNCIKPSYANVDLYVTEIEGLEAMSVILSFQIWNFNLAKHISTMEASKGFDISHKNS